MLILACTAVGLAVAFLANEFFKPGMPGRF